MTERYGKKNFQPITPLPRIMDKTEATPMPAFKKYVALRVTED